MKLTIDIETIPAQRPDVLEEIRQSCKDALDAAIAGVKAPSNYGTDTAAKWMAEKGSTQIEALRSAHESEVDAAYRKTGLDGAFGHICVIGWAFDDREPQAIVDAEDESGLLRAFREALNAIEPHDRHSTTVIGHNVASFDLRFLAQRSIVHGIRPHLVISRAAQAKPWESEKVFDTMVQWAGVGGKVSLDKLCKALSIPTSKGELDGSKVWDFVKAGRIAEVANYCKADVTATREVYRRMTYITSVAEQRAAA